MTRDPDRDDPQYREVYPGHYQKDETGCRNAVICLIVMALVVGLALYLSITQNTGK